MIPEVEVILDLVDAEVDSDWGTGWREVLRPHFEAAWYDGYATAQGDCGRWDEVSIPPMGEGGRKVRLRVSYPATTDVTYHIQKGDDGDDESGRRSDAATDPTVH